MWLILGHDLVATAAAIIVSLYVRVDDAGLAARAGILAKLLPAFLIYAALVFTFTGLNRAKWRFTSLPDLMIIVRATTILAATLLAIDYVLLSPNFLGTFFFGKVTIALYWFMEVAFLAASRIAYRYFRYTRTLQKVRTDTGQATLILGRAADVEVLLRAIESGAVRRVLPVGVLSPSRADRGQAVRGVFVLGGFDDLEQVVADLAQRGTTVTRLLMAQTALLAEAQPEAVLIRARRLGLTTSRLPSLDEGAEALQLAPVNVEDLLLRPSVKIDYRRLEQLLAGKAAVVTGGGGSIGSEICERLVAFGVERLLIIENSELALHTVLGTLAAKESQTNIEGRLADIRDRERLFTLIQSFRPDFVFHAAALKHVPLLERDRAEAIKTNVFGSINVADAALAAGTQVMVMISTDKAIEPVSVLGATKRLAEMYCQALDAEQLRKANGGAAPQRLIAVRFGNVLASNGSVVPKFKAQIEAGGPVTVTHPDMVRFFMTIREACDLVLTSGAHAIAQAGERVSIYVLNMGQAVRIVELAERMIRLSGLEPGKDIEIVYTGMRPGERLHEILFARDEPRAETGVAGIVAAQPVCPSMATMRDWLTRLESTIGSESPSVIDQLLRDVVPDFRNGKSDAA
jgi:O-antigen biosynthesis protein WbqV